RSSNASESAPVPAIELADEIAYFEQQIRPLLAEHCFECHSAKSKPLQGGLRLDTPTHIRGGGESGPALLSSKPDESLLIQVVRYKDPNSAMPPKGKLPDASIAKIERWIQRGAAMPSESQTATVQRSVDVEAGRNHWAFLPTQPMHSIQPLGLPSPWVRNNIDHAVFAKLEELELHPSTPSSRRSLLRRLKVGLLGVVPSEEEVTDFESDPSCDAYERWVDRFLDSPQYGERWARYWLDLVRYCDTMEEWTETIGPSYPYRDWVIDALNKDLPYDQFIHLQLAADQLPNTPARDRAALGFLGLSPSYWKELQLPVEIIKTIVSDEIEERVHTVSSTFLGLNLACARCHDHKYDPITNLDYYAIAGILANTKPSDVALAEGIDAAQVVEAHKSVKALQAELQKIASSEKEEDKAKSDDLKKKIESTKSIAGYDSLLTPGVRDSRLEVRQSDGSHGSKIVYESDMRDALIEIRGNPNKLGPSVPRRYLSVLERSEPGNKGWNTGSGRLDLARSITLDSKDLVARVIVNRVWKNHFGRGLVETPSDFGRQGEQPTHPELLDDLAYRFIEHGWSLKWLQREIVLSATYQQARGLPQEGDPDQRYYSSFPRRPLDVEAWRDSLLQVSDGLISTLGGPATALTNGPSGRRTIYLSVRRRELNDLLRLFDFPDPLTHSPNRVPTVTPLQQLYVLNSQFILERSGALVERLEREQLRDNASRVQKIFQWLYQREPSARESSKVLAFLDDTTTDLEPNRKWKLIAQTLLASNEFYFLD
ncbi:MAG: DUF1553 domain-containing protein, partial [Planctomycetes bacterium]|nr:DUF1553 domain-containing protein [Planctomycetota bacterium]